MANEQQNAFLGLVKGLPQERIQEFIDSFLDMVKPVVEQSINASLGPAIDKALRNLGYTEAVAGLIHLLSARSNDTKENVLQKALTLYGLALDAREKGNRLAIITPDDELVHDIVGFDADDANVPSVAR